MTTPTGSAAAAIDSIVRLPFTAAYNAIHGITVAIANTSGQYRWYRHAIQEDNLKDHATMDDYENRWRLREQMTAIEQHHSPSAHVEALLGKLSFASPLANAHHHTKWAWQRLNRGWDDRALWNIDRYLCATLGNQMLTLADNAHGYPSTAEFPTYESWVTALRHHGYALKAASDDIALTREDESIWDDAQESLHWVADHLRELWD